MKPTPPDADPPPLESATPARFPPTTDQEKFRTLREPQSPPAAIPFQSIPTPGPRQPWAPSAAAGPVGGQRRHANIRRNQPQPMLLQLHVTHNAGQNRTRRVRECRTAKSGMELIGHRGPADLRVALKYQRSVARLSQVERGDQPIVAAANDDDIAPLGHAMPPP